MENITAQELKERQKNNENIFIIDVREEWEYDEKNIGAKNIPLGSLPFRLDEIANLKEKEIIVHCKSGNRSSQAKKYLSKQGFTNVRCLEKGIEGYLI